MRLALGWTILHSLWEGALAALLLAAALSVIRPSRARYAAACLAMLGIFTGFGVTFSRVMDASAGAASTIGHGIPPTPLGPWDRVHATPGHLSLGDFLPWLAPLWLAGVILFHLYSLANWIAGAGGAGRGGVE